MSEPVVLDASAILALLLKESGHERVEHILCSGGAVVCSANVGEVVCDLALRGMPEEAIRQVLELLPLSIVPLDEELAVRAGLMGPQARVLGLSFGDRACLALASRLGAPVLTAEGSWLKWQGGPPVICIR